MGGSPAACASSARDSSSTQALHQAFQVHVWDLNLVLPWARHVSHMCRHGTAEGAVRR